MLSCRSAALLRGTHNGLWRTLGCSRASALVLEAAGTRPRVCCYGGGVVSSGSDGGSQGGWQQGDWGSSGSSAGTGRWYRYGTSTAAVIGALGLTLYLRSGTAECKKSVEDEFGLRKAGLPTYRRADVAEHNTKDKRIWVTFKNGVYDVTDFMGGHPGGTKILLAAGKQLEPFFDVYAGHKTLEVMEQMEELRIGNVHPDDMKDLPPRDKNDPFANDPKRHPALMVNSEKPFNAEPPPELLIDNLHTPNELFFVRNHLPVPKIDDKNFKVEIMGIGMKRPIRLTVADLKKKFEIHTIAVTIQCAGNRRTEMSKVKSVKGLSWGTTAISNAQWTGVKLSDVLRYAGVKEDDVAHVLFQGMDIDVEGIPYETSIPAATAFDPRREVLLAFAMNGKDIPIDHGYPLRAVVPGVAGARQVKWLRKIILSKEESGSHWQQNDYKSFNPSVGWENVDFSKSVAIQEYPIQSAICEPVDGSVLPDNEEVTVKGYAWSGGGRGIIRVDVSIDGGKTWRVADLEKDKQKIHREWGWTLWEATIPIPLDHKDKLDITCKAIDTSHNTQPETAVGIWNLRGLINNAWHHIHVQVPEE